MNRLSIGLLTLLLALPAASQQFSINANPADGLPSPPRGTACGTVTVTHSASQAITQFNSVSCNAGGLHTDNSYFRAFALADFGITDGFDVCSVDVGIESAVGAGGTQPMTVNVYTEDAPPFPGASRTLIGTADVSVADQALAVLTVPVTGTAAAGSELVVEVFTPEGQTDGNSFFIGSNADGETAPSYIQATDCGINSPTPTGDIGFADMQIVMNVSGTPVPTQPITEIPTAGFWGLLTLITALGIGGLLVVRRMT